MKKILIVEDSHVVAKMLAFKIRKRLDYPLIMTVNYAETQAVLEREADSIFAALLDLQLPDALKGEVVELVQSYDIPCIIFTGSEEPETRKRLLARGVVDYIYKRNLHEIDYLVRVFKRLDRNPDIKVLIVIDTETTRLLVRRLLEIQRFEIIESQTAEEALEILSGEAKIKLVIVDFLLPEMDGVGLITEIRRKFSRDEVSIIGISGKRHANSSAKLLKSGANDFLHKPFTEEEFHCRVIQNIEVLEQLEQIEDSANRDFLTKLHNRRFFYRTGEKLFHNAHRNHFTLTITMLDIDHFKKVNDTYGHEAGDLILLRVSEILSQTFRKGDIVARFGGEEFCIACLNLSPTSAVNLFERVRQAVEAAKVNIPPVEMGVTISIGICTQLQSSLEHMIRLADKDLYQAKNNGRNCIFIDGKPAVEATDTKVGASP
ncbi:Diguanylate cyclase [Sulfidibacter corallicola]|uniref:diguanylate cyclase n=1 Tax=Sulfidibacter corallicola TaxID=2818388 RepID=A0A8A4TPJ5_SULCO|nr:diguanylate cyclase [Sulfidibacter corallicola]QTD50831.1 diguanylate cyclase [Sulfidibacter corallicola]